MKEVKIENGIYFPLLVEIDAMGTVYFAQQSQFSRIDKITIDAAYVPELIEILKGQLKSPNH